ncbi:MAG: CDP-alcohol phosphatidyltransferase family protein [Coriobacteriia bacterium]
MVDRRENQEHEEDSREPDANPDANPETVSNEIYTVANVITLLRLILIPFFFAVLIEGQNETLAVILFAIAASTDWVDGQIARRTGTVTTLGKAIDPLVDRLLIASGVLGLYLVGRLPIWTVILLVGRDVYLLYGAWRLEQHQVRLPVLHIGKATTAVLLAGFALLLLGWPRIAGLGLIDTPALPGFGSSPAALGIWFVYAGIVLSLWTAIGYTREYLRAAKAAGTSSDS